jgi:hypothetical protein
MRAFVLFVLALVLSLDAKPKKKKLKESEMPRLEWYFSEVTYSPINDRPSVSASLPSVTGREEFNIFCDEGKLGVNVWFRDMYISTLRHFAPVIYRVDSEPAVDCIADNGSPGSVAEECYIWSIGADNHSVGIWGIPESFIEAIKDAKKLTVRVSNVSGEQSTAFFLLKDVLPTFEKIKSLCTYEEATTQPTEESTSEEATP